jgi:hypothetical protein
MALFMSFCPKNICHKQFERWIELMGTNQPKNLRKIKIPSEQSSGVFLILL